MGNCQENFEKEDQGEEIAPPDLKVCYKANNKTI